MLQNKLHSALEVINDFRIIDLNKNGEITEQEFTDALRSNPALARKFGLSDDILSSDGTREKYEGIFGKIDENKTDSIHVNNRFLDQIYSPECDV